MDVQSFYCSRDDCREPSTWQAVVYIPLYKRMPGVLFPGFTVCDEHKCTLTLEIVLSPKQVQKAMDDIPYRDHAQPVALTFLPKDDLNRYIAKLTEA